MDKTQGHATSLNDLRTMESPQLTSTLPKSIEIIPDSQHSGNSDGFEMILDTLPQANPKPKLIRLESHCSLIQFGEDFHDELLKYNNCKLLFPNLCEWHETKDYNFAKFPGETILSQLSVSLHCGALEETIPAFFILTDYRLLFMPLDYNYLMDRHLRSDYFSLPLMLINTFKKTSDKKSPLSNILDIATKCGRKFKLGFAFEDTMESIKILETLEKIIPPPKIFNNFAFVFHCAYPKYELEYKGWKIFDTDKEFKRQGITFCTLPHNELLKDDHLKTPFRKISNYAQDISKWHCESYPSEVVIPALLDPEEVLKTAKYRTKHRLPALTYCYKVEGQPSVCLWRSSQCKPGFARQRSPEDEQFLRLIGNPFNRNAGKDGLVSLHIYDARPYLNAVANKMNGKGYENQSYYRNIEIFFLDIDNIHGVRDKYRKLIELSTSLNPEKWTSSVDHNGWINTISYILSGAKNIVEKSFKKGRNVLVHCSDGWDRTTQLVCLVQIMLDPYFRTIEGFAVLIQKDWISFGHMFKSRNGWKPTNAFEEDKRSPIFIQFLDCVHQLLNQFPAEFEFNLRFLVDLAYYSKTGLFGTFICDNLEEIIKSGVLENTTSIWSFILANKGMYKSNLKTALSEHATFFKKEILPDTDYVHIRFWKEYYCFYARNALEESFNNVELDARTDLYEVTLALQMKRNAGLVKERDELSEKIKQMAQEIADLKQQQQS